jgi:hypothetical protein
MQTSKRGRFQLLNLRVIAVLLLNLLGGHGAFAQKVTVEFDQPVNFSKHKTFAIRDGQLNSKNPALNSDLVKKRIDADIEKYLTAKGLTLRRCPGNPISTCDTHSAPPARRKLRPTPPVGTAGARAS